MVKWILAAGAIGGFLSVTLGAFAAHGLKSKLDAYALGVFQTGVQYQMYHSLALIGLALLAFHWPQSTLVKWSAICFIVGIAVFSGSLYVLALSGVKWLGAITPFGGLMFLAGWVLLLVSAIRT